MEGNGSVLQPPPAIAVTPYQRLTQALQTDPRCAQEVNSQCFFLFSRFCCQIETSAKLTSCPVLTIPNPQWQFTLRHLIKKQYAMNRLFDIYFKSLIYSVCSSFMVSVRALCAALLRAIFSHSIRLLSLRIVLIDYFNIYL